MKKNKSFFITAFNRDDILKNAIISLTKANKYDEYNKLIIYQDCTDEQKDMIYQIDPDIKIIKTSYSKNTPLYQKVSQNIYYGFQETFEKLNSSFSIHIEDDILVTKNIFNFYEQILKTYSSDKSFFAVNGMSKELFDPKFANNYSKFIWGICKCWGIPKNRWLLLKKIWADFYSLKKNINQPHDGPIEIYIKKNIKYVIMPHQSLILEQLSNGLNSIEDPNYPGFKEWKNSFDSIKTHNEYIYNKNMPYSWRPDCIKYSVKNILTYKVYFFLKKYLPITIQKVLRKIQRSFKLLNKCKQFNKS